MTIGTFNVTEGVVQTLDNFGTISNVTVGLNAEGGVQTLRNNHEVKYQAQIGAPPIPKSVHEGVIENLTMNGGRVENGGRIENLTYVSGEYQTRNPGRQNPETGVWEPIHYASIGTLNYAGNENYFEIGAVDYYRQFGNVDTININKGGEGTLTINGPIGTVNAGQWDVVNNGRIENLIYTGGDSDSYRYGEGTYLVDPTTGESVDASIGTLHVHADAVFPYGSHDWGKYDAVNVVSGKMDNFDPRNGGVRVLANANVSGGELWNGEYRGDNFDYESRSSITDATISGGALINPNGGKIENLAMTGGNVNNMGRVENLTYTNGMYNVGVQQNYNNYGNSSIGTLTVEGFSPITSNWGKVESVIVNDGGTFENLSYYSNHDGGYIPTTTKATVNGGVFVNAQGGFEKNALTATVNGGTLNNNNGSVTATVDGGTFHNVSTNGSVVTATVNSGTLNNSGHMRNVSYEQSASLVQKGGTVNNGGWIDNMTYFDGDFSSKYNGRDGSIGKLTIAGDSTGIEWGTVGEVVFSDNGNGIIAMKAVASTQPEPAMRTMSALSVAAAEATRDITFTLGIEAEKINLDYSKVIYDFSEINEEEITSAIAAIEKYSSPAAMLGMSEESITGTLQSVEVVLKEGIGTENTVAQELYETLMTSLVESKTISNREEGSTGNTGNGFVWTAPTPSLSPEPATLLMLGLGLAGLGLARWRK